MPNSSVTYVHIFHDYEVTSLTNTNMEYLTLYYSFLNASFCILLIIRVVLGKGSAPRIWSWFSFYVIFEGKKSLVGKEVGRRKRSIEFITLGIYDSAFREKRPHMKRANISPFLRTCVFPK